VNWSDSVKKMMSFAGVRASPLANRPVKGKIVQYVGRTLRNFRGKSSVRVYDYLDAKIPVLSKMHFRRLKTY
jgi:hypothetical protein